ncbi:hypothetical protein ACLK1Z_01185 [Escherichia coli]
MTSLVCVRSPSSTRALEMINKRRAKNGEPPLDIAAIPLDDKEKLRHAATLGNHGGIPA